MTGQAKPYVYRGTKREGLPDLEEVNRQLMRDRGDRMPDDRVGEFTWRPDADRERKRDAAASHGQ